MNDDRIPVRRALLSVSDKTDLIPLARALLDLGVELISTGGTASALREAGIAVRSVEDVTGFPEMLEGRVKTLHPAIHGALLARPDRAEHRRALAEHDIRPIDLVCVNLYPFEQTVSREGVTAEEAIEQIDIGGPAVVRSAAKNCEYVAVVTSPDQYDLIMNELRALEGATTAALRRQLAAAAFARTAEYDTAISAWMSTQRASGAGGFPEMLRLEAAKIRDLRYGENPHQRAAVYADPASAETGVVRALVLHGKPLSFNNLLDAAAALELVQDLSDLPGASAAAAIIKHTNACGAAVAAEAATAFERAWEGDPLAAYGGVLTMSGVVDEALAERLAQGQRFLEVIVASGFEPLAVDTLASRWPNVRLLATGRLRRRGGPLRQIRSVPGGFLVQDCDLKPTNPSEWEHVAGPPPAAGLLEDAAFTWMLAKHLKSNAVAIGAGLQLIGAGPGQVDRVGACRVAVGKAGERLAAASAAARPAVAASDGFFPFPDGPAILIEAGVRCIVQPGGSKRDRETVDLCEARGVTCLFTGTRHFRH